MGVTGLLTYILEHDGARRTVHLAELADRTLEQTGKEPKIVCDYLTVKSALLAKMDAALIHHRKLSRHSLLYGGNYQLYAKRVLSFVRAFQHLGINLVFFVDGPLGVNETELQAMLLEKKARYLVLLQRIASVTQICDQQQDCTSAHTVWEIPQLASLQALMTLRDAGAQIIICQGEADMEIAEYARSHKEVLGVLSRDADFSIMKNCTLFPIDLFDSQNTLGFRLAKIDETPGEIVCEAVSPATLASSLDITEDQLPELSFLCGNHYTRALNNQLDIWIELEFEDTDIESVAKWLREKDVPLTNYQPINNFLLKHPEYSEAVQCSYQFYTQNPTKEVRSTKPISLFYSTMKEEIQAGCMLYGLLTIVKNGTYWRLAFRESLTLGHPSMHDLLLPVRKVMYMLLGVECVREFGRTPTHSFTETSINVDIEGTQDLKLMHSIRGMDNDAKMAVVFHLMMSTCDISHSSALKDTLEKVVQESPFIPPPLSVRDTMMCTALQYTTKINETLQSPHSFTDAELAILLVSCLTCCAQIPPLQTSLLPSMRAITFSNRFLYTLEHVYYLASLVGLGRELPEPKDLFYSMAFVPYHILVTHKSDNDDNGEIETIRAVRDTVLSLEAVRTFNLAIVSPDQPTKFCELVHLFSSAVKAVENNRESLIHNSYSTEAPVSATESEQSDTDEKLPPVPQILSPDPTVLSNQKATSSTISLQIQKSKITGFSKPKDKLPVFEHRDNILQLIASHKVVCIVGQTGCGKSSQIPQYIVNDFIKSSTPQDCRILVSQPNHTAAKNLATRVAFERKEEVGRTVGYCSEKRMVVSEKTLLTYCTTEYMLKNLVYKCQGVCCYTHVIIDEVHDRSTDMDFTLLVVRNLALKFTHLKVILMSATLQSDLFIHYFEQLFGAEQVARPYFVGMKRFRIAVHFIDQLDTLAKTEQDYWNKEQLTAVRHLEYLIAKLSQSPELASSSPTISKFAKDVCTELIISQSKLGEGILVFLPGFSDITDYYNELCNILQKRKLNDQFLVFVFYTRLVPSEEQNSIIFHPPPRDKVHVILSGKGAESSITIPKLRMVINFGINQNLEYDSRKKISRLQKRWCSRSSCSQREGRVGRVFEGIAVHLFTREFFDTTLSDFDAAEITKSPLPKAVLKAKELGHELNIPLPSHFLSQLIQPPSLLNMEAALQDLVTFGAITYNPDAGIREDADITLVGNFCLSLPLDLKLGRLILFGIFFGCPFDAIVMAAALSMYQDTFTLPTRLVIKDLYTFCRSLKRSMDSRLKFDYGYYSDPIMMCNMFIEWIHFRSISGSDIPREILAKQFSYKYSVRPNRLLHFESLVGEIASYVCQYIPSTAPLFEQMQLLSHVVEHGSGRPYFEKPGASSHHRKLYQKAIPFCDDSIFLKAVLAAAFANQLIYGKRELESFIPYLRKRAEVTIKAISDVQFDPCHTIAMEVGEDEESEEDEESKEDGESKEDEESEDEKSEDEESKEDEESEEDEEFEKIDENILQKLVKKIFPRHSCETKIVDDIALIQFEKLLNNDCISDFVRFFWQFPEGRDGWQIEGINAIFSMPFHPYCLSWSRLTIDREIAHSYHFDWRNPTGFVCKMSCPNQPLFAVASEMIGKLDFVYVSHITILPQMPQGLLMMLAFQPISTNIELLLEKKEQTISAVRINSREIEHTATYINTADIWRINKLRKALSEAMTSLNVSTIPIDQPMIADIPTLLQDVLTRRNSDLPIHLTNTTVAGKGTRHTHSLAAVWETVVPGADYDAVTKSPVAAGGIEVSRGCSQFYPTFQCSLIGGQPHSVKEVLTHGKERRVTISDSVSDSVATVPYESEVEESENIYVMVKEHADRVKIPSTNIKRMDVDNGNEIEPAKGNTEMSADVDIGLAQVTNQPIHKIEPIALETVVDTTATQCEESSQICPVEVATKTSEGQQGSSQLQSPPLHILGIRKLEQEIVRYLKRNNMMEFLSKLQKNERVKSCCGVCNIELNRTFFVSRLHLFQVKEGEDDDEDNSLIVLNPSVQTCQSSSDSSSEESEEFNCHNFSSPGTVLQPSLNTEIETSSDAALQLIPSVSKSSDPNSSGDNELQPVSASSVIQSPESHPDLGAPHSLEAFSSSDTSSLVPLTANSDFSKTIRLQPNSPPNKLMCLPSKKRVPKVPNSPFVMTDSEVPKLAVSDTAGVSQLTLSSIEFYDSGPSEDMKVQSVNTPTVSSPTLSKQPNLESSTTTLDPVVRESVCSLAHHTIIEPPASANVSSDAVPVLSSTRQPCASEDINLQPRTAGSIPTQSSKTGFTNHMVQYFVDYLQKRSGEASITSLRRAFATYVETLPDDTVCPYLYLSKSFFESHPQYFKLVQGCGFCTVKLSMTSADSESLTSGNAASSVQPALCECVSASDSESIVKQKERSNVTSAVTTKKSGGESAMVQPIQRKVLPGAFVVTKVPDTIPNDVAMMTSSSSSDPEHRMDVQSRPTSSSVVCQPPRPDSEGDSGKFTSPTVSSTIQPCSYVPEASQISKLQPSDPLLIKTIPHKHSKPGTEEHVIEFFIDYLKTQSGEASITSLQRKVFPIYLKRFSIDVKDLRINKEFFRSNPRYFKLIQGDGFCTVRLSRMPPDESRYDACDRNTDSAETAQSQGALTSDSDPKVKQNITKTRDGVSVTSAATTGSHLAKAEVSMCEQKGRLPAPPDEKTVHATKSINVSHVSKDRQHIKWSPASSSIPEHQYSKSGSGKTVSAIVRMPSTVKPSARQNSKPKPSDTKGLRPVPPKPGSDQHMVEFFVDYLKKRGGEASLSDLLKKAFPVYVRAFPNDVVYLYLNKWFFESRPQYFELIQEPGFCTVRASSLEGFSSSDTSSLKPFTTNSDFSKTIRLQPNSPPVPTDSIQECELMLSNDEYETPTGTSPDATVPLPSLTVLHESSTTSSPPGASASECTPTSSTNSKKKPRKRKKRKT